MNYYEVGENIRRIREYQRLSQEELAELAGIHRVTLARYESGKVDPGAQQIGRIAEALGVSVDAIMGVENKNEIGPDAKPRTVEARIVSFGMDRLPQEDRERLLAMIRAMYANRPDLFDNKKGEDNEG